MFPNQDTTFFINTFSHRYYSFKQRNDEYSSHQYLWSTLCMEDTSLAIPKKRKLNVCSLLEVINLKTNFSLFLVLGKWGGDPMVESMMRCFYMTLHSCPRNDTNKSKQNNNLSITIGWKGGEETKTWRANMVLSHTYGQLHYLKPQAGDNQSLTTSIFHEREGTFYELDYGRIYLFWKRRRRKNIL